MGQAKIPYYVEPLSCFNSGEEFRIQKWRKKVLERDGNRCRSCYNNVKDVFRNRKAINEAHHIIPKAFGGKNTLNNGITLCVFCHDYFHSVMSYQGIWYFEHLQQKPAHQRITEVRKMLMRNYVFYLSRHSQ